MENEYSESITQINIPQQKKADTGFQAEKSITDFFNRVSKMFDEVRNPGLKPEAQKEDNQFKIYSQAFQGFAQNNVSKSEGFSISVKVSKEYDALIRQLTNELKKKDTRSIR